MYGNGNSLVSQYQLSSIYSYITALQLKLNNHIN